MAKPLDPNQQQYVLSCVVQFVKGSTTVRGLKMDRVMAILVPKDNDQREMFLRAWLPDVKEQSYEVVGYVPGVVDSPCRFSVHRGPDAYSERHYLFVMSKGVEETLVERVKEGSTITGVKIYPADHDLDEEASADNTSDGSGNYEVLKNGDNG